MKTILSRMVLLIVMLFVSLSAAADQITREQLNKIVGTYSLTTAGMGNVSISIDAEGNFVFMHGGDEESTNLFDDDEYGDAEVSDNCVSLGDGAYNFMLDDGVATHVLVYGMILIPREGRHDSGLKILALVAGKYEAADSDFPASCTIEADGAGSMVEYYGEYESTTTFNILDAYSWCKTGDVLSVFLLVEVNEEDDDEPMQTPLLFNFILRDGAVVGFDAGGDLFSLVEKIEGDREDTVYLVVTYGDKVFRVKADDTVKVEWKTAAELRN